MEALGWADSFSSWIADKHSFWKKATNTGIDFGFSLQANGCGCSGSGFPALYQSIQLLHSAEEVLNLMKRQSTGAITLSLGWLRMGFKEECSDVLADSNPGEMVCEFSPAPG